MVPMTSASPAASSIPSLPKSPLASANARTRSGTVVRKKTMKRANPALRSSILEIPPIAVKASTAFLTPSSTGRNPSITALALSSPVPGLAKYSAIVFRPATSERIMLDSWLTLPSRPAMNSKFASACKALTAAITPSIAARMALDSASTVSGVISSMPAIKPLRMLTPMSVKTFDGDSMPRKRLTALTISPTRPLIHSMTSSRFSARP